jgi:protein-S-isoprenylcysteine O-methyltransferase Ste14
MGASGAGRIRDMPPLVRFVAIALSVGGYFGLAVLGEGGLAAFFANPALKALTAVLAALGFAAFLAGGNLSSGEREDRSNRWVIPVFGAVGLLLAYLPAYHDRIGFLTLDGDTTRWIGVALFAMGGALRLWPVFVLGNRFSGLVAIQAGHRLVTSGVYGVIRHPSYLGLLLSSLGWVLAFRSGAGVILAALLIIPTVARIRAEEALLHSEFGDEYEAYRARRSRLIPGVY